MGESVIAGLRVLQEELNHQRSVMLKLMDPDVVKALQNVARSNFKRALIVGTVIGFTCGAGGMILVRLLFKLLGWI